MQLFARITKIDEATRRVYGVASSEAVDHAKESLDYDASKGYFVEWSNSVAKATDGKSVGNLRAMHGNVVAGKLVELQCDDATKSFPVCAEVVDDNEWKKTLAGCYTGFSIGGKYVFKAPPDAAGVVKYTAKPNELSLVDLPCNPDAQFTVVKADGAEELRKFVTTTDNSEALAKWAGSLTDAERGAVLAKLAPAKPEATPVVNKRQAFAEKLVKCEKAAPVLLSMAQLIDKPLRKGMYAVGELADLLCELGWMAEDAEWEAQIEGDNSPVPEQLRTAVKGLAQILITMANEEATELAARFSDASKNTPNGDLTKGAPSPKEDAMDAELKKSLDTAQADLAKAIGERDELKKAVADRDDLLIKAAAALDERNELIKKLEAMPEPVKVALRSVAKSDDVIDSNAESEKVLKGDGTVDEAATAIKKALMNPVVRR